MAQKRISDFFGKPPPVKKNTSTATTTTESSRSEETVRPPLPAVAPAGPAPAPATQPSVIGLDKPFQPTSSFKFPAQRCGNETFSRSVAPAWFARWQWLHYVEETDHILCFVCLKAVGKKVIPRDKFKKDNPFVNAGFSNWPKANEKFNQHERSELHTSQYKSWLLWMTSP